MFFFNNYICLILFPIQVHATFQKDTTLFTKNGHVLSHPTHLFTNTYYLHTYLIYSYTHLTLQFPFSISFPAQKRFSLTLLYSSNPHSYSSIFFILSYTLHLLTFFSYSLILYRILSSSIPFLSFSFSFLLK